MSTTRPTHSSGSPTAGRRRHSHATALLAAALGLALSGCTGTAEPSVTVPSAAAPTSASSVGTSAPADALVVDVTIANGDVTPNGQKLDVAVGQQVVLNVTSDEDDQIHAHTDRDGYELPVTAGRPTTGSFTLNSAGSFEVESHHLEKVIVILNAR